MLTGIYKKWFLLQLKIASTFCSIPFEWDNDSQRICEMRSKFRKAAWFAFVIVQWMYVPFLLFRLLIQPTFQLSEKLSVNSQFQLLGWIAVFTGSSLYHIPMVFNRGAVLRLTNSIIGYEIENHGLVKGKKTMVKTREDQLDELILLGSCVCSVAMPVTMTLFFWARPCSPQFLGSLVINCNESSPTMLEKFPFLVFEILLLHPYAGTIFFCAWCLKYAQLKCLVRYLRPIRDNIINHNPLPTILEFEESVRKYLHIQVLVTLYNDCFLFTTLGIQAVACGATIAPLYVAIRMYGIIKMPGYIFFPMTSFQASLVIFFLFGAAGDVFKTSESTSKSLERLFLTRRMDRMLPTKLARREILLLKMLQALSPMKIRSGGLSFIDKNTIIVLLRFCLDQTISLLLIRGRNV